MKEYLAFDVGGTSVKYALCNEEGEVSSASKFKTPDTLDQMYLEMEKVVHNYPNVEGIALSMPGAVDSDGGIIYGSSAINYIHGPNIKEDLQNRFHKPVELENDANCAALAEVWKGVAKEESDCCFIVSGTGIGGAVIKDKHVHHGNALHGGEFGYTTKEDFRAVAKGYRENHIPIDMIYMDIDYMQSFKDFTVNEENFPDFPEFVQEMDDQDIRLIPIIDAGVKVEPGYEIYEEGVKNNYFCKREDGSDFVAAVWPGDTHFPDMLNPEARKWFGDKYRFLIEQGIEGFWNDMNEPAIFYSSEGLAEARELAGEFAKDTEGKTHPWEMQDKMLSIANNPEDYKRFYHNVDGKKIRHDKVHNLFGYNMTRAAGEAFERIDPEKRFLMFSRSSYIGMHRYGGIWTGDNKSWWSHILLNLKMLPSLNMCGFLYTGADLGGFGADTTRELLLRFLALGVFTPLMRNHSATGTREQECYQFENIEDFRAVINTRYRLVPYLYSEYMKAALSDDMYFKPLGFVYPDDKRAIRVEDQLMLGNEIMIAPVYEQNARGRYVYLPEEMKFVKFLPDGSISEEILAKGIHYVDVASNEVPLFIRNGKCIPVAEAAECVKNIDTEHLQLIGYENSSYTMYEDDGIRKDYDKKENYRVFTN